MESTQTTTSVPPGTEQQRGRATGVDARARTLIGIPVADRRLELAGVSTAVLEGGGGPPLVLLHGPAGNATHWARVIPDLMTTHRVVAPDLPGQGGSELRDGEPTTERVVAWLGELIERTCDSPPALVGFTLGGAIAARFAVDRPNDLARLVLVDALGLSAFEPAPQFARALNAFQAEPTTRAYELLMRQCMLDLDRVREQMGRRWDPFEAYNVQLARTPSVQAALATLMGELGIPAIPEPDLERIAVPTTLIWGRQDLATPLEVAEAASARYGWPLEVIEDCADEPPFEQPEAFLEALRTALNGRASA